MACPSTQPGTILRIDRQGVHVATGAGSLVLTELQKPGGKRISASQLAQNLSWVEGSLLA
jgi:methionyl-tRNA formyltransferase